VAEIFGEYTLTQGTSGPSEEKERFTQYHCATITDLSSGLSDGSHKGNGAAVKKDDDGSVLAPAAPPPTGYWRSTDENVVVHSDGSEQPSLIPPICDAPIGKDNSKCTTLASMNVINELGRGLRCTDRSKCPTPVEERVIQKDSRRDEPIFLRRNVELYQTLRRTPHSAVVLVRACKVIAFTGHPWPSRQDLLAGKCPPPPAGCKGDGEACKKSNLEIGLLEFKRGAGVVCQVSFERDQGTRHRLVSKSYLEQQAEPDCLDKFTLQFLE
jgi:hypothetical protein